MIGCGTNDKSQVSKNKVEPKYREEMVEVQVDEVGASSRRNNKK